MMLLDCGAPKAVTGRTWMQTYIDQLTPEEKENIKTVKNNDRFVFGPSRVYVSNEKVNIPLKVGKLNHMMEVALVDAEIPLLIGRDEMEKLDILLRLKKREAYLGKSKETVKLEITDSGHLGIQIAHNEVLNKIFVTRNATDKEDEDIRKTVEKVHKSLGHMAKERLWQLFKNAGLYDEKETKEIIWNVSENCEICRRFKKTPLIQKQPFPKQQMLMKLSL